MFSLRRRGENLNLISVEYSIRTFRFNSEEGGRGGVTEYEGREVFLSRRVTKGYCWKHET